MSKKLLLISFLSSTNQKNGNYPNLKLLLTNRKVSKKFTLKSINTKIKYHLNQDKKTFLYKNLICF